MITAANPEPLREQFRRAAWALANYPLPDELVAQSPTTRPRLGLAALCRTIFRWRVFARWLDARGVTSLDEVTGDLLVDYSRYLVNDSGVGYFTTHNSLFGLTRLYALGLLHLPTHCRISAPPWLTGAMKDYLPRSGAPAENRTPPIHPDTMGPLLVWSLRVVDELGPILAAIDGEHRRIIVAGPDWLPFNSGEVQGLHRHLVTACYIVIAYLTGMRPAEVLALKVGCCPEPDTAPSQARHYAVFGRHFKDARDEHGNHLDAGLPRDAPWITVPQVAAAIRILERLVTSGLLFDAETHDHVRRNRAAGRALTTDTIAARIDDFTQWVNDHLARGDHAAEAIPTDPNGKITATRFRRTLAWHIARKPDGLVALAVQYGHLRTVISEGYASRSRDGIHELLDFETARTIADHLADLGDDLARGEGVSGPAARRLIQAVDRRRTTFVGMITTKRQYRALLADPLLNVFENKRAYLTCNYDPAKALCREDRAARDAAPSLDRCQIGCANIARTDHHAEGLRVEADRLEKEAAAEITPELIAGRLRNRAEHLRALANQHDLDRITIDRRAA